MNRLLAALRPGTTESDGGCCPECSPECRSKTLREQSYERALRFWAGVS